MAAGQLHNLVVDALDEVTRPRLACPDRIAVDVAELAAMCGTRARDGDFGEKWRWRGHEAARLVACYLAFLLPPAGWRRDRPTTESLLWWRAGDGPVLADVVWTRGRGARLWSPRSSGLPRRLLREGRAEHGDGFVGVRLLSLAAPAASLLVDHPSAPPGRLALTPWWFHDPPLTGRALAVAAGEGPP